MKALKYIAKIQTDFPTKFGIPRIQSGLVNTKGTIVFEPEYRKEEATKRTRRMFTSVADLGVFRGCQNRLESDRASAAAWGE